MSAPNSLTQDDLGSAAQRERRKRILDATISLATSGGFDAVQMRAVAESAEVALGTLYRYFPSKIHLLVSALGRQLEQAEATYRADLGVEADIPRAQQHPGNVWSLHGYHECLVRLGKFAEAAIVEQQLRIAKARADVPINASCFCRLSAVDDAANDTCCGSGTCSCC